MRLKVAWKVEKDDAILVVKSILGFKGSKPEKINLKLSRTPPAAPADVIWLIDPIWVIDQKSG